MAVHQPTVSYLQGQVTSALFFGDRSVTAARHLTAAACCPAETWCFSQSNRSVPTRCPVCRAKRGDIRKVYNLPTVVAAGGADASTAAAASLAIPLDDAAVPRVLLLKEQQLQKERRERERLEEVSGLLPKNHTN